MMPFYEHNTEILRTRRESAALDFPLHIHSDPEFIYLAKGELTLRYIGRDYALESGDFAIVFPYSAHEYITPFPRREIDYSIAILQLDTVGDFKSDLLSVHAASPVIKAAELHPDIPHIMQELVATPKTDENKRLLCLLIQLVLARCMPCFHLKNNTKRFEHNLTVRAITYVFDHFKEHIDLQSTAAALGVSTYCVSRLFTEKVHFGFNKYVNYLRIEQAKELLCTTDLSILEISIESGFDNLRTFNRVFKELCGETPLHYRKACR